MNARHILSPARTALALQAALLCAGLIAAAPAWAGPPFATDDPEPVEYQHHEFSIATSQISTVDGKVTTPLLEYNYGLLPDVQVSVTVPYVISSPTGLARQQGPGDLVMGVKYRFLNDTDASQLMMSVYPVIVLPNGDANKGLGNGGAQLFLPVWVQKSWGKWQSYGGGGYWINKGNGAGNHWYFGWALQYALSEEWMIGGEVFSQTDQLPVDNSVTGINLGGSYKLDAHNRLVFSVGRGLSEISSQNSTSTYFGYRLGW